MNKQLENIYFVLWAIIIPLWIMLIFYGEDIKAWRIKSYHDKQKLKQKQGVVVHCKTCNATGETEQDVNLLMSEASFAIWYNVHLSSNKCEICSKDKLCDVAQQKHDEIMKKYKELGPKIEKATCPDCMGAGTYTQYDGYRFGREKL